MITEALLVVIVSGVAALGGSAINGAVTRAKTRSELEASPYTALATRVVALVRLTMLAPSSISGSKAWVRKNGPLR